MKFAVRLTKENHELGLGYVRFHTIFGDVDVKNKNIEVVTPSVLRMDCKYFTSNGFNPCQLVNGFIGTVC